MSDLMDDTIAAISTPPGEGAISVIRVSGPDAFTILHRVFRGTHSELKERRLTCGRIVDGEERTVDAVLAVIMRKPRSYTGEDVVEINCHGGLFITRRVLEVILGAGARLAERGEFTRRAFLNGKIDLAQAEAVIDLIKAGGRRGAEISLYQMEGRLSALVEEEKNRLLEFLARIEGAIDFSEEEIDFLGLSGGIDEIRSMEHRLLELIDSFRAGRVYREGVDAIVVGKPNVGKSSLFNALIGYDRAIVSAIPGTTRDAIDGFIEIDGIGFRLMDTAGIRESSDLIEREGTRRTLKNMEKAQMAIVVVDGAEELTTEDREVEAISRGVPRVIAVNKCDLRSRISGHELQGLFHSDTIVTVSALRSLGLDALRGAMVRMVESEGRTFPEGLCITRERHVDCLRRARKSLLQAISSWEARTPLEFVAFDIRESMTALGEMAGEVTSEDVLNRIFEEFCIGK
jgi:tRNA modification GTPase